MPLLTVSAVVMSLLDRARRLGAGSERGGPMAEYAVILGVAAVSSVLVAILIAFIRGKFAALSAGG